jgi:alpha-tubulin suppressor-like RCC1 family protein
MHCKRCVRVLALFGLVLAIGCGRDITEPEADQPEFVLIEPGTVAQVSVGGGHTCALRTDGTVACWGLDGSGQATPPAGTFTQVSAGGFVATLHQPAAALPRPRRV